MTEDLEKRFQEANITLLTSEVFQNDPTPQIINLKVGGGFPFTIFLYIHVSETCMHIKSTHRCMIPMVYLSFSETRCTDHIFSGKQESLCAGHVRGQITSFITSTV